MSACKFTHLLAIRSGIFTNLIALAWRVWLPVLQILAVLLLTGLIFRIARNEPCEGGVIAVFLLLALPSAALLFGSRRTLSIAFTISGALLLIERTNIKKRQLLAENLHLFDLLGLWEYTKSGDFILLYHRLLIQSALVFCTFIIAISILRIVEERGYRSCLRVSGSRTVLLIVGIAAVINAIIFINGNYFWGMSSQFVYARVKSGPIRISNLLASGIDFAHVENNLSTTDVISTARAEMWAGGPACSDCPDIITVHVESVFDPIILQDYADAPSLTSFLSSQLTSRNGPLKIHVMGGWSIISEFSFNCGLDHRLFGTAGLFPNMFLSKAINRCIPGYLRDYGYRTEIVSSAIARAFRIADTYKAYGVDHFNGRDTFSLPPWEWLRDGYFVDDAIKRLQRPRVAPRLLVLLTGFNHGPHGDVSEIYSGPYDLSRARTKELRDYMNRLNDSITAFRRLEEFIATSKVPTVIIYYGDHQPNFKLDFSAEALGRFGKDINQVTFYRMARNFRSTYFPRNASYLGIDQLYGEGLAFGGVRQPPELLLKDAISRNCPQDTSACGEPERRAMRAIILK